MRYTLPNGDWVDLVERLNYAQARRIAEAGDERAGALVAAMVTNWAIRDVDGEPIAFPELRDDGIPIESIARMPFDSFQLIGSAAVDLLPGQPDPKGSSGTSPSSAPERPAASRRTSPRPTSSPITRDGAGRPSGPPLPM